MFAGIIQKTAKVIAAELREKSRIVRVQKPAGWRLKRGASVAVDGICSTIRATGASYFEVEYMPETLSRTTAGSFTKGRIVNLERSLRLADVVDGHFVQGHIDTRGEIVALRERGASSELIIRVSKRVGRYIALKGSITVSGVSLTVCSMTENLFGVALVSYTRENTNLSLLQRGDTVNVETDLIARYLARLIGT